MNTTVITPTTGDKHLAQAILSVQNQTVKANHLIVIDGLTCLRKTEPILTNTNFDGDVIILPYNTGGEYRKNRWNGHRIYSAIPKTVNTSYVSFLDEDNWYEPEFVSTCEMYAKDGRRGAVTVRRNVYKGLKLIGTDDFESIGHNSMGYCLHDTNTMYFDTYLYSKHLSQSFYYPLGADKYVSERLYALSFVKHIHLTDYLVNYRSPRRLYEFFEKGCTPPHKSLGEMSINELKQSYKNAKV